eukprot:150877_1
MAEDRVESKYDNPDINVSSCKGNEILTLCIGQCGVFAGNEYINTIMNEHKLNKDGVFTGNINKTNDGLLLSKINTCFTNIAKTNQYTPRTLFMDIDSTALDTIRCSPLGTLLPSHRFIDNGYSEPSVIFPKGYYTDGMDLIDTAMDSIRQEIETYEYFQGVNMIHALSGGCGSGFASLLLNRLSDDYPRKYRFTHTIWPCLSPGYGSVLFAPHNGQFEAYNTILAVHELLDNSEINFVIQNGKLLALAVQKLKLENPTYDDMNWMLSLIMSGTTSPFRFISEPDLCSNLKKMDAYFRVFPKLHFLNLCHSPFFGKTNYKYNDHNVSIVSGSWSNDVSRVKQEDGKMLQTATFYRSNDDAAVNEMNKFMFLAHQSFADDFVQWIPNNTTSSFMYDGGFECYKDKTTLMATTVMHNTAIKGVFQRASALFARHYKRKTYLHFYKREGMELQEFVDADRDVRDLITELQDKQDAVIQW